MPVSGPDINPATYHPKTLASEIRRRGQLPPGECVRIGLSLTAALEHLHQHHLIHRDIKPSNIIFVHRVPKLADIGLVTEAASRGGEVTYLGTEGYISPEGPATPAADLYSLGKVIYELVTGLDRRRFPELPTALLENNQDPLVLGLNRIIVKACAHQPHKRYPAAAQMHTDLLQLCPPAA